MLYKKIVLILALCLLIFGMTGFTTINGSSVVTNTNSGSTRAKVSGVTGTINVGVVVPLTGGLQFLGTNLADGAKAAAYEINNTAGFPFKIHVVVGDGGSGVGTVATSTYNSMKAQGIQLIIGAASSSASIQIAQKAISDHIVQVSYASTSPVLSNSSLNYFFRVVPTDALQGQALASLMYSLGAKNIIIVNRGDDYGTAFASSLKTSFTNLGGKVLANVSYDPSTSDFGATASAVKAVAGAQAIAMISYISDGGALISELRSQNITLPLFGTDGTGDPSLLQVTTAANAANYTGTRPFSGLAGVDRFNTFNASLQSCYTAHVCTFNNMSIYEDFAYDAMYVGALAVNMSSSYSGSVILTHMRAAGQSYVGATGNKTFSTTTGDIVNAPYDIWQFQKGNFEIVGNWTPAAGLTTFSNFYKISISTAATPGFELLGLFTAVALVSTVVLVKRKKKIG